jgi:hypothetical protein
VLGHLPYVIVLQLIGRMTKGGVPEHRHAALAAELGRNDRRFVRRNTHTVLRYYDEHGHLAAGLCDSRARAWVVFGEKDGVKLLPHERRQHPERIAALMLDAFAA